MGMSSPGAYFRPGVSAISIARHADIAPSQLRNFLAATVPHVEQLCLALDSRELLDVALGAGPKVRFQFIPEGLPEPRAWWIVSQLADHEWSFHLLADEILQEEDFVHLRKALPHAGPKIVTLSDAQGEHVQVRLWRTGWNLSPLGNGRVTQAGPAASYPKGAVPLSQLPTPKEGREGGTRSTAERPTAQGGPVLVCGMHRSGTSMTTRLLNLLGIALSDQLLGVHTPAGMSNPKGHWEDLRAMAAHQRILRAAIGLRTQWEWMHAVAVAPDDVAPEDIELLSNIANRNQQIGRWGIKDPRVSLLLPLWLRVVPDACIVLCVRNPLAVARSLYKRDVLPVVDSLRMWAGYNERILESASSREERMLVVHYDNLISDLQPQLERIARFLALDQPTGEQRSACEAFVDDRLRHHTREADLRQSLNAEFGDSAVQGEVERIAQLYEQLCHRSLLDIPQAAPGAPAVVPSRAALNHHAPAAEAGEHDEGLKLKVAR